MVSVFLSQIPRTQGLPCHTPTATRGLASPSPPTSQQGLAHFSRRDDRREELRASVRGQGLRPLALGEFSACPSSPSVPWSPGPSRHGDLRDAELAPSLRSHWDDTGRRRRGGGCGGQGLPSPRPALGWRGCSAGLPGRNYCSAPEPAGTRDTAQVPRATHAAVGSEEPSRAIAACNTRWGCVY